MTVCTHWSKLQNREYCVICQSVLSKGSAKANDAHIGSSDRGQRFQWCHETALVVKLPPGAWEALVLSVRQVVYVRPFIQLFMCFSPLVHLGFGVRIGWQMWISFYCLIGLVFCIWLSSVGSMASLRVGRVRWKGKLMNGDSKAGGCGSLKTQSRWIELRLTGHCPLSSDQKGTVTLGMQVAYYANLLGDFSAVSLNNSYGLTHWWGRALHHHWKISYHWNPFWIKRRACFN